MRVLRVPGTVPALVYILTVSELVSVRVCVCPCVPCGVVGVVRVKVRGQVWGEGAQYRCAGREESRESVVELML